MQILNKRETCSDGSLVFTTNNEKFNQVHVSQRFKKYVLKSKLNPSLRFHSLRHTFASWLVQKGVSIYQVSKLLGHSDIKTTQIYAHLRNEDLQGAVDLLD